MIDEALASLPQALEVQDLLELPAGSASRPITVHCTDGSDYKVKGQHTDMMQQSGKMMVNDQIGGKLGEALGAPVPSVALAHLTQEFVSAQPHLQTLVPGLAHASKLIPEVDNREAVKYTDVAGNRSRFALLAVLYSWAGVSGDQQLIYGKQTPTLVYSVDHGMFFPSAWTHSTLANEQLPSIDPFFEDCHLTRDELQYARLELRRVTHEQIATAVASPPREWGISMEDRIAVAEYLSRRQMQV